jgi:hypothetical protein
MHSKDNWKWGLVFILLAIFLVTANQAYKHIASQEDFAPPDDYKKGDSWDLENPKSQPSDTSSANSSIYNRSDTVPDDPSGLLTDDDMSNDSYDDTSDLPDKGDDINWDEL